MSGLKQQIEKHIEKRQPLTKAKHSDQPIANMSRRAYWEGYVDAKKEDLGLLAELQDFDISKWLRENKFSCSSYPIKRFIEDVLLGDSNE